MPRPPLLPSRNRTLITGPSEDEKRRWYEKAKGQCAELVKMRFDATIHMNKADIGARLGTYLRNYQCPWDRMPFESNYNVEKAVDEIFAADHRYVLIDAVQQAHKMNKQEALVRAEQLKKELAVLEAKEDQPVVLEAPEPKPLVVVDVNDFMEMDLSGVGEMDVTEGMSEPEPEVSIAKPPVKRRRGRPARKSV